MSCGIYKITNTCNGLCYVGQSIDIGRRWCHHRNYPLNNSHYPLYQAFKQYGIENFTFEVLEECSPEQLDNREIYYIQLYDSYNNGYNQTRGGSAAGHIMKLSNEDVITIYDLLLNSDMSQHDIAVQFNVRDDTISEINHGKTRILSGYTFPLRERRVFKYCLDCGKKIKYGSRCIECTKKIQRIVERPDRNTLKQLIRSYPFTQIGKMYGVSDNAIRRWCEFEHLPKKVSDIKQYSDEKWRTL